MQVKIDYLSRELSVQRKLSESFAETKFVIYMKIQIYTMPCVEKFIHEKQKAMITEMTWKKMTRENGAYVTYICCKLSTRHTVGRSYFPSSN